MLRASKVRTSKSKSPYARPPTRGAVVASRASTRMPNVTSSSSGPSTVAVTESTGRIYDRSQSLPVPVVQPTVQPVLDRARAPSDQTVEPSVAGSSTNTGTDCLFDIENPTPFHSVVSSLGAHVPIALKEKIWNNDYIALNKLLMKEPASDIQHHIVYHDGAIQVKPKYKDETIVSISQWTDAFLIFASIYCVKHSSQAVHLFRYMATIRKGAERSPNSCNWREYDVQFRLKKSIDSSLSWGSVDAELWLFYMQPVVQNNIPTPTKQFKCYSYNFQGVCEKQNCRFLHICVKCNGSHPSLNCRYSQNNSTGKQYPPVKPASQQFRPRFPQRSFRPITH